MVILLFQALLFVLLHNSQNLSVTDFRKTQTTPVVRRIDCLSCTHFIPHSMAQPDHPTHALYLLLSKCGFPADPCGYEPACREADPYTNNDIDCFYVCSVQIVSMRCGSSTNSR
jgi:hypothetical protein